MCSRHGVKLNKSEPENKKSGTYFKPKSIRQEWISNWLKIKPKNNKTEFIESKIIFEKKVISGAIGKVQRIHSAEQ